MRSTEAIMDATTIAAVLAKNVFHLDGTHTSPFTVTEPVASLVSASSNHTTLSRRDTAGRGVIMAWVLSVSDSASNAWFSHEMPGNVVDENRQGSLPRIAEADRTLVLTRSGVLVPRTCSLSTMLYLR